MSPNPDHVEDAPQGQDVTFAGSASSPHVVFQVSLRAVLLTLTSLTFVTAAVFSFPPILSAFIAVIFAVCAPAMLAICIIYGRGRLRAFAIGMLLPTVMRAFGSGWTGSYALYTMNSSSWQSYPGAQGGDAISMSSGGYFRTLFATWQSTGHALMADETMFWLGSAIAGIAAMAVYARITRD